MIKTKITSSLEKPFLDQHVEDFPTLSRISALRGERISFQILFESDRGDGNGWASRNVLSIEVEGDAKELVTIRSVQSVPVELPVNPNNYDDQYLRTTPGLYPDVLRLLHCKA